MQLQPSKVNGLLKKEYAKAGIRYDKAQAHALGHPMPERDSRKVPSKRVAARSGVLTYYDNQVRGLIEHSPDSVKIPLRQHIGAPSQPVVETGAAVNAGDLIAQCPEGKLGANIHASISGEVTVTDAAIIINGH
jgi:hypothetical protein